MKIVVSGCVRHRGRCVSRTDYVRKTYSIQGSCGDKKRKRLDFRYDRKNPRLLFSSRIRLRKYL